MRVLVAGGGIGGMVLALSLEQRGIDVVVLESSAEMRELGVGINLLPHAVAELAALDLLAELDEVAIRTRKLRYLTGRGQQVWAQDCGQWAGHRHPQFSVHRGRLHALLVRAAVDRLGDLAVRPGHELVDIETSGAGITAVLADGSRVRGDCLVGADGIHSRTRALLHPDGGGVRWNGVVLWRGATDWPSFEGGDTMAIAGGTDAKLVLYPIAEGTAPDRRLTNWAITARVADPDEPPPKRQDWRRRGHLDDLVAWLERFDVPLVNAPELVRATPEFYEYPMCDRDPLPWWTRGRVTLLGDAAHPMYPMGSNGAAQAILDGRILADLLAERPIDDALSSYEAQRLAITSEIVRNNRNGGPERMIDLVTSRAPDGFDRLEDVVSHHELAAIASGYRRLTAGPTP